MTEPLRIALVGAGVMGRQHAAQIDLNDETELVAIADPFSSALAQELNLPGFREHRQMLEQSQPDAVIIANPNNLHVATALDCIEAGIPMLLEKPVGCSVEEVKALVQAEAESGVAILVGHHRRHNPIIREARRIIQSGELGQITTFTALWQLQKADSYYDMAWRRSKGAGVLLINLVHDLDLMRHLCGEVGSVQAITSHAARGFEVEDSAALLLQFKSGALGTLTGSDACATPWGWDQNAAENPAFAQQPEQPCYLIGGTLGSLSVPQLKRWHYGESRGWYSPLLESAGTAAPGSALDNQLRHFVQVVRGHCSPLISADDALQTLRLVEAAQAAGESGRAIKL
ncbi:Gfo/Idh/MocA family protein [Ectopseudomonas mendocina]|uniref:Gfo/Idh/MocA family oxidoreductase n=1 Tax=Ectopseudomonas mendocina TaxID=300 RepID=A0A2R3QJA6_ECTME|nr:Gfo/Idh/MocA family oxidoreductase [Pseudomonas mendocina]AVO51859.1 gfo/Idh/MocA family oxidoreductase [Pseudomonas mendocina]